MNEAAEFFAKLDAGVPESPELIVTQPDTAKWYLGVSQAPLKDGAPEPFQLTEAMVIKEEIETPEGRTIRYSGWSGPEGEP